MERSYQLTTAEARRERHRTIYILFGAIVVFLIALGAMFAKFALNRANDFAAVNHTQEVIATISVISNAFADADIEGRDAILNGAENAETASAREIVKHQLIRFRELTFDNPRQQNNVVRLSAAIERRFTTVDFLTGLSKNKGLNIATDFMKANHTMSELRAVSEYFKQAQDEEQRLLTERQMRAEESRTSFTYTGAAILLFAIAVCMVAGALVNKYLNVLENVAQKFRDAYINARTGRDGMLEMPRDLADDVLDFLEENKQAVKE